MADGLGDIFVGLDDFRKFSADSFLQNANRLIGDVWTQHTIDNIPQMAGDIWTQHVTNQLPNLTSMLAPPAPPPPQTAPAASPDPFAPITSPSTTPTIPTAPAPSAGVDSGTPPPAPPPAPAAGVPGPSAPTDTGNGLIGVARQAAQAAGVDPDIFVKQIQQESGFNPNAKSPAGAIGIAQFMPATAQGMGVDPTNPVDALQGAARLMADNLKRYGGDYAKALAAYNAGPGNVDKYGGVPPFEETQRYVKTILSGAGEAAQQAASGAGQAVQSVASAAGGALQGVAPAAADKVAALADQAGATGQSWLDMAKSFLGKPYIWGSGSGAGGRGTQDIDSSTGLPRGFDCSGFVSYILQNGLGIDLPAQTAAAYGSGKLDQVDAAQAQPGDVVFYNMNSGDPHMQHMALYMGNGKIIEAGGVESDVNVADANAVGPPTFMRPKGGVPREATNALSAAGSVAKPSPSVFGQTFMGTNQPAQSPQPAPPSQPPKSIWDQLGGGISDVFKNVFGGGGSSSTPPPPPEGGGYGAAPPGGQNPLPDVFASIGQAAQTGQQKLAARGVQLDQPGSPTLPGVQHSLTDAGIQLDQPGSPTLPPTPLTTENFPSILDPNHPANVYTDLAQKYASPADPFNLRIRDRMPPEDQAKWDSLATQVGGVEMPTLPGGDLAPKAGNINLAKAPEGINPFALHAEPGPNRVPLTVDEAVSHLQDLEAQYTRNDATIQTLENRLSGPTTGRGSFTGTVVRPPWGVGWTNDALAAAAQQHGVSPYQDLWWEQAGLNTGSAEVKRLSESGLKGTGNVQQTPTQMRSQLEQLYAEQEQIMQATEHATANGDRTLYRPLAPVSELPFAEYTPPETNAVQPAAAGTGQIPDRTLAPGGGTTAPASSGSVGTAASTTGEPAAAAAAVAPAGGGGTVPPIRPPSPPMSGGTSPIPPRGPTYDPSRAFDYDRLAQMRQDFESRQPQLDLKAPPKPNTVDKVISYTVNNMLSGVGTQIQNIMGNLSATVSRPLVTAGGGLTGDAGLFVDAARDVAAMGATFSEAFSRAGQTLKTGVRSGQPEQFATSAFAPQLRLLSAGDEFFRTLNAAGGQAAEVSRLLRENPSLSFEETLAKYQGRILAAGEDAAARSVYEKGGIGWGESIAQARSQLLHSDDPAKKTLGVILNAVVPFSKVPDTILTLGVRGLPGVNEVYGIGKTVSLLRQGEVYAARREAGATALLTAANLGILAQALQGNITGDGPDDPTLLSQMMAARDQAGNALWRPHSVKLPDGRWIDYGFLGPMEIHMAAIANVVEGAREQGGSINPQPAQMAINRLTKTVGNLWYLRGLSDVLSAINGGQLATPNVANSIEAIGDRFVWQGSLLNELRQLTDPTVRDPQNPLAREANRIPGLETLVPARTDPTTGQPLQRPQDVLSIMSRGSPPGMSPGSGSAEILSRSDVAVSPAPKQITVGKFPIQLTHDEQQQYTQLRGQLIDQMVAPLARDNAFQTAPLYVREQVLRKMLDQASSAANKMLIGQLEPNSLNQRLQQSQQTITTNTPFLPEDTSAAGRVPALAR